MTSLSSSFRSPRSKTFFSWSLLAMAPVMAIVLSSASGCADKHIGRPCMTGRPADPGTAIVNPQALECPSRICLLPAQTTTRSTTGPLCTDYCSSDDDCSDAEKSDGTPSDPRCHTGFACRTPVPNVENSPIACKRVCVCRDFLLTGEPDLKPPGCP